MTHLGLGDNITTIGSVRYLATCYDKVIVVCKKHNLKNLELFYNDDDTIELYPIEKNCNISPNYGFSLDLFKKITNNMDLYISGSHCFNKIPSSFENIPYNFYKDMGLDETIFKKYFHVNKPVDSKNLYEKLYNIKEYIFIHNSSSTEIFTVKFIEDKFNINRNNILIINPNTNIYNKTDVYYDIANYF